MRWGGGVRTLILLALVGAIAAGLPSQPARGSQEPAFTTEYLRLAPQTRGVLYTPTTRGAEWSVGVVNMHTFGDYHDHLACSELAKRGFRVLCANGRYVNNPGDRIVFENMVQDVRPSVTYMRELAGIEKVVLMGHSAGAQQMAFYQNVAENGVVVCQGPEKLVRCPNSLADLPAADGLVLLDGHPGGARFFDVDPAVRDEANPELRDPTLDMFDPANGYRADGPSSYSDEFKRRFYQAQGERMNRLIALAEERQRTVREGRGTYPDTEPFVVPRAGARLWLLDTSLVRQTQRAYPILRADGSQRVEVPQSVRLPDLDPRRNDTFQGGTSSFTLESFMSSGALRANPNFLVTSDAIEGVDWASSNTSTVPNVAGVHVPLLIMAMGAHYFMVPSEMYYDVSPSADKTMVVVEGANHGFTPCRPCEQTPGEFGDTVTTMFDYFAEWLRGRFVAG